MIVGSPRWDGNKISSEISSPLGNREIWFAVPARAELFVPDGLLIATLMPAMVSSDALEIPESVSPRLLNAIPLIQEILVTWDRHYWARVYPERRRFKEVVIRAYPRDARSGAGKVAAFFSAGVDSFYTALKHSDSIDALIYIHRFDVSPDRPEVRHKVIRGVREAASELGKPLIEVETNLESLTPEFLSWGTYHGAVLASVGALLGSNFRRVYVPSSYSYAHLRPWGSSPILDPLWSTDEVEMVHDGCEFTRNEKVAAIASNEVVRSWLRVCMENPDGAYNCASCDKCLRTMVRLRAIGALESFTCFPPLDVKNMRFTFKPRVPEDSWRRSWEEIWSSLRLSGRDPELENGIKRLLESEPTDNA